MGNEPLAQQRRDAEPDQQSAQGALSLGSGSSQSMERSLSQISAATQGLVSSALSHAPGTPVFQGSAEAADYEADAHVARYRRRYGDGATLAPLAWDSSDDHADSFSTPVHARSTSGSLLQAGRLRTSISYVGTSSNAADTRLLSDINKVVQASHEMAGPAYTGKIPKPKPEFHAKYFPYKHQLMPLLAKMAQTTTPAVDIPPCARRILALEENLLQEGHDRAVFEERMWKDDSLMDIFRRVVLPNALLIDSVSGVNGALRDYVSVIQLLVDLFPTIVPPDELILHCVQQWATIPREGFAAGVGSPELISSEDIDKQLERHRNTCDFVRQYVRAFLSNAVFADMAHATQSNALRGYLRINDAIVGAISFDELAFSSTCIQTIMRVTGGYDFKASNNRSLATTVLQSDALKAVVVAMFPTLLALPLRQPRMRIAAVTFPAIMQLAFSANIEAPQLMTLEAYLQANHARNDNVSLFKSIAEAAALFGRVDILEEWNVVARLNLSSPRRILRLLIHCRPDIRPWILTQLKINGEEERAEFLCEADEAADIAYRKGANYKDHFLVLDEQKDHIDSPTLSPPWASYWR